MRKYFKEINLNNVSDMNNKIIGNIIQNKI